MSQIEATRIFYRNAASTAETVINRGGARSSKSYSVAQLLTYKFLTEKKKKILVIRKTAPSLRLSILMDFKGIWSDWGVRNKITEEKQFLNYFINDNYLHFGGLDDPEKIKSSSWNYIMMEEATEFSPDDYLQLKLRLSAPTTDGKRNQIFLCFNPIDEFHWINEKIIKNETIDQEEIVSSYKDNPFLSETYTKSVEALKTQDYNYYRIYALGEWGKLENIIYKNWEIVSEDTDKGRTIYGIDFGFNAPASIVKFTLMENKEDAFCKELLYKSGLTNSELIALAEKVIPNKRLPVYADSAEPDRILEFKRAGFNIKPAKKNVNDGIDYIKRLRLHVHKDSANMLKEIRSYSWKTDRNGRVLDEPVKFLDHTLDAVRYAGYSHFGGAGVISPRVRYI